MLAVCSRCQYHVQRLHSFSQDPSAAASTRFQGDAIAIYGTSAPDHAGLRVTLDGEVTIVGGGRGHVNRLHSKVLLVND